MSTGYDQLSGWTEKLQRTSHSQIKLAPNKGYSHCWWSSAHLNHYSFPNPGETITSAKYVQQINEMHQKLNTCSQDWSTERTNSSPRQCSMAYRTTNTSKVEQTGLHIHLNIHPSHLPVLLPINYHFFKHLDNFLQKKHFHNQQDAENAFQEFVEPQSTAVYATGINKLTFYWQISVEYDDSYFD